MKDLSLLREEVLQETGCSLFLEGKKVSPQFSALNNTGQKRVCAVDGGSSPLLVSPHTCVFFVRVATVYMKPKKVVLKDSFVIIRPQEKDGELFVQAKNVSVSGCEELFYEPLATFGEHPSLEKAGGVARKLLEWRAVDDARTTGTLLLWDGSLSTTSELERRHRPKGCVGVAKSTGAMGSWQSFMREGTWAARVAEESFFVKLHEKSTHVLRVDTSNESLLDDLVAWSCDPVFLGYPYPLVVADELARISFAHNASLRAQLQAVIGSSWEDASFGEQDAHTILDSIKF